MDTKRKNKLNLKILLVVLYIFTVIVTNALFTIQLGDHGNEKLKWVTHTNNVIIETKEYLSALKDTETGQRGYLLTMDNTYLKPYNSGLEQAEISFLKLSNLTSDNQNQTKRLKSIHKFMELKFKELKETIEIIETKNYDEAIMIVKRNDGKKYMDEIRSILSNFINEEVGLLNKRKEELQDVTSKNLFIVRTVAFSLLLVLFYVVYINLKQKHEIQLINDNLELKIKEEVQKNRNKDKQLLSQSRLAQMGEMISMIAHQWRQPLGAISTTAANLQMKIEIEAFDLKTKDGINEACEYFKQRLENINDYVQNLTTTIDDFRNFYKPNKKSVNMKLEKVSPFQY